MLHYLDDLDSKMESMRAQFEREAELDSPWTSYNPSLARPLLNSRKFLEKGLTQSQTVEPANSATAAPASHATNGTAEADKIDAAPANGGSQMAMAADTGDGTETSRAVADSDADQPEHSAFAALQRKFESHKVTAADKHH